MNASWKDCSKSLVDLLELEYEPVAVKFTNEPTMEPEGGAVQICQAIKQAAKGRSFVLNEETSACPGGSWHCGLVEKPQGDARRFIQRFLTRGEKLTRSIVSFERMIRLTAEPPTRMADYLVMGPARGIDIEPDLFLFTCDPEQACRILTLDQYWDGIPPRIELSGSLCHMAIAYPVVTGNTNVTFGDWTARRMTEFDRNVLFVTVPAERMPNLVAAIPECSAGTASFEMPQEMQDPGD